MSIAKLINVLSLICCRNTSGTGRSLFLVKIMRSLFPTFRNAGVMPDLRFQFYRMQFFRIRRAALITQSRIDYVNKRFQTYEWHVPHPSHIDFPLSSTDIQYMRTFVVLRQLMQKYYTNAISIIYVLYYWQRKFICNCIDKITSSIKENNFG